MPRATTKRDLIESANEQFDNILRLIDAMPDDELHAAFYFGEDFNKKEPHWKRDKNMRDVLVHLYEWHQLLLNWAESNQKGEAKPFIPMPYIAVPIYCGRNIKPHLMTRPKRCCIAAT